MKTITFILIILSGNCYSQGILGVRNDIERLPANPSLLTWTKIHEERFLELVDNNFIHYASDFAASTSNLTALSGSAPAISGGNLVIDGSVKYQSTSTSVAAALTAEMTIASMGSVGDSNKLGPAFMKSSTDYIAVVYDKVGSRLQIIQRDTVLYSNTIPAINTTNLKLFLLITGRSIAVWYQESGEEVTCGFIVLSRIELQNIDITEYKYGVYCLQSGSTTTHNVSSLRGTASGGVGLFNDKIVRNLDGSDYIQDGKLLMTADLSNPSARGGAAYVDANSVVIAIDTATFEVEIVGRIYYRVAGTLFIGQDLHVIWDGDQWLCTYVPIQLAGGVGADDYFYVDSADLFTELIIDEADITQIGWPSGSPYDVSTRIIDGLFYSAATNGFAACLYSGATLDDMDAVTDCVTPGGFDWECASWIRYMGEWYLTWSGFGDTRQVVLTYLNLELVGYMDLPFVPNISRIPGYDWYTKQTNGRTTYHMIGFDTQEFTAVIPNLGSNTFPWTLGRLVVWKATETRTGYEF